jgi:hypothetical protein
MEKVEQPISIYLFELVLVLSSGVVGLIRLYREETPTVVSILAMFALPLAATIVAGAIGRHSIEGRMMPHWSVVLALPLMHAATLFALAKLIEEANTGIQAPAGVASSLVWVEPGLILISVVAQTVTLGLLFAVLRRK